MSLGSTEANGFSAHYGAVQVLAEYAGVELPDSYTVRGIWPHGVFGPWASGTPDVLVYNTAGAKKLPVFMHRVEQALALTSAGHRGVQAVGSPFAYASAMHQWARVPGRVLLVHMHSLPGQKTADPDLPDRLAKSWAKLFPGATAMVRGEEWAQAFTRAGLQTVPGASTTDPDALYRQAREFSRADAVVTNGWGSHVAYALASGCELYVCGQRLEVPEAEMRKASTWRRGGPPDYWAECERELLAPFTAQARRDLGLGRWLCGYEHVLRQKDAGEMLERLLS